MRFFDNFPFDLDSSSGDDMMKKAPCVGKLFGESGIYPLLLGGGQAHLGGGQAHLSGGRVS